MTKVAELEVVLSAAADGLIRGLKDAEKRITGFGSDVGKKMESLGTGMQNVGGALTMLTGPLTAFGAIGVKAAMDFDSALAELGARTGIVGDDMARVKDFALEMGAVTAFSAQEAAQAMLELTSSGQSVEQAMATLPAVLDLAAAGGLGLKHSADGVTDALAMFGLGVDQANAVVNALSAGAGSSSASVEDLLGAFKNVGPVAKGFGITMEDTVATLAVLAENGMKGEEAGTRLKSMLLQFNSDPGRKALDRLGVSMYNASGEVRNLDDILGDLNLSFEGMTQEERISFMTDLGGSYGLTALQALLASGGIGAMTEAMAAQPAAADVAAARMDTFAGKVEALKGSIETAMINAFTPFIDNVLAPMVDKLVPIVNEIGDWAAKNPELTSTIIGLTGALTVGGIALVIFGTLIKNMSILLAAAFSPLGIIFLTLAGVVAIVVGLIEGIKSIGGDDAWTRFGDRLKRYFEGVGIDIKVGFMQIVADLRQKILDATGGNIDIAPNIEMDLKNAISEQEMFQQVENFTFSLERAFREGRKIDMFGEMFADVGFLIPETKIEIQQFMVSASYEAKENLKKAIATELEQGTLDQSEIDVLVPIALELGFKSDDPEMIAGIQRHIDEVFARGLPEDVRQVVDLALDFGIDNDELRGRFMTLLHDTLDIDPSYPLELFTPVAVELGIDMPAIAEALRSDLERNDIMTTVNAKVDTILQTVNPMDMREAFFDEVVSTIVADPKIPVDAFVETAVTMFGFDPIHFKSQVSAAVLGIKYREAIDVQTDAWPIIDQAAFAADVRSELPDTLSKTVTMQVWVETQMMNTPFLTPPADDDFVPLTRRRFRMGSSYIPNDGLAYLHRGERVLTAAENRAYEGGGGNTYYITSYGQSPQQLLEMLKREAGAAAR